MTKDLLDGAYARELAEGRIKWQEADFQENEALANKFEVFASCVVVARIENGNIVEFERLDDVWTLMNDQGAFNEYIGNVVDIYLKDEGHQS